MESRLAAIAGELAAIEKQGATPTPPGQTPQTSAMDAKRQQLLTEQSQLSAALPPARQTLQFVGPEVERLKQESQRIAAEVIQVDAERKAVLAQIDASLDRLRGELSATGQQSAAAGEERHNHFLLLGQGVYEKKKNEPALAEAVQGVQDVEGNLASAAGSLRTSLAMTQAMPRGTMAKFVLTLVGTPLLVIGLIYVLAVVLFSTRRSSQPSIPKTEAGIFVDPRTELTWTRKDNGSDVDWYGAKRYCDDLTLGGFKWRMPTIDELETLYDPGVAARYKIRAPFELTTCCPWSSTMRGSDSAWNFDFYGGTRGHTHLAGSSFGRALCVRRSGE